MESFKGINKIALPVIILSISVGASPFLANEFLVEEEEQFSQEMSAKVISEEVVQNGTRVGVDPGTNLNFGEIETGIGVTKYLEYESSGENRLVSIELSGNLSEKINLTEKQFIDGKKDIPIAFKSEEPGFYSGELTLKTETPNGELGERWLEFKSRFY